MSNSIHQAMSRLRFLLSEYKLITRGGDSVEDLLADWAESTRRHVTGDEQCDYCSDGGQNCAMFDLADIIAEG